MNGLRSERITGMGIEPAPGKHGWERWNCRSRSCRKGTCFPSLLELRKPAEKALLAVVQQAYLKGVSTRKVDALVKELGLTGIDKSKVSRICKELDDNWRAS